MFLRSKQKPQQSLFKPRDKRKIYILKIYYIQVFHFSKYLKWIFSVVVSIIYKLSFLYKNATLLVLLYSLVFIFFTGSSFFLQKNIFCKLKSIFITSLQSILLNKTIFKFSNFKILTSISIFQTNLQIKLSLNLLYSITSNSSLSKMCFFSQFLYLSICWDRIKLII